MQHLEQVDNLADRVWRPRLLAVAEGRIRDQEVRRGIERLDVSVKNYSGHGPIRKHLAQQIGLRHLAEFLTRCVQGIDAMTAAIQAFRHG